MQSVFYSTVLKISQGLSRDKSISFLRLISGWAHSASFSFSHHCRGQIPNTNFCWRGFWTVNILRNLSLHNVKEWTAQQFLLGRWEKMLKGNIRDKAINLDDKKKIKNVSQACFWLGPDTGRTDGWRHKAAGDCLGAQGAPKGDG